MWDGPLYTPISKGHNFQIMLYFSLKIVFVSKLANSADPDEMPQYVAFHLGRYCLLKY